MKLASRLEHAEASLDNAGVDKKKRKKKRIRIELYLPAAGICN